MKYVWITIVSAVVTVLIIASIMLIYNKSQREVELDNAINSASKEALETVFLEYSSFESKEQGNDILKWLFEKKLNERIVNGNENDRDDNLEVEVNYLAVDSLEGMLSVEVKEYYTHIGGGVGSITSKSTVLIDEETSRNHYILSFMVGNRLFRSYILNEGDKVIIPPFDCAYWKDEEGVILKENDIVTKDKVYEASV